MKRKMRKTMMASCGGCSGHQPGGKWARMERRRGRARHVSALWRGGMRRGCGVWAVSEASRKGRLERRPRRPDDDDCGDGDDDVGGDDDSFHGRDDAPKDKCAVGVGLALVPAGQRAQLDAKQRVALDVLRADGALPKRGADNAPRWRSGSAPETLE